MKTGENNVRRLSEEERVSGISPAASKAAAAECLSSTTHGRRQLAHLRRDLFQDVHYWVDPFTLGKDFWKIIQQAGYCYRASQHQRRPNGHDLFIALTVSGGF